MEEVTKCSYVSCVDSQEKEQIFHELPVCDIGLCVKWLINSGHEDLVGKDFNTLRSMKFFICNNHFTGDCYLSKGTLKESAVPRPYWNSILRKREPQTRNLSHIPNINIRRTSAEANPNDRSNMIQCDGSTKDPPSEKGILPNGEYSDQWCRTCATKKPNLVSMIAKNKKTEMSLLSKLKLLIEIDDEDTLPLNMCWECVRKLEQSFQFFQQIYIADNTLRHIFPVSAHSKAHNIRTSTPLKSKSANDDCLEDKSNDPKVPSGCSTINRNSWRASIESKSKAATTKPAIISRTRSGKEQASTVRKTVAGSGKNTVPADDAKETVLSLLKDPCVNDRELRWIDVLKITKQDRQKSIDSRDRVSPPKALVTCEFCDAKFKLRKQLKSHLATQHLRSADSICKDCVICYNNKSLLLEHRAVYHNDKRYNCDYCQSDFARKSKLRKHMNKIHVDEVYYSCNEKFKTKEHLLGHIEALHLSTNSCSSSSSSSNSSTTSTSSASSVNNRSKKNNVTQAEDPQRDNATVTTLSNAVEPSVTEGIIVTTSPAATTTLTTSTTSAEPPSTSTEQRSCSQREDPIEETTEYGKCSVVAELPLKRCRTEYHCERCSSFFTDADALEAHLESHRTADTTSAPSSPFHKTEKPETMSETMAGTTSSGDTRCDECNIDLCNVDDLRIHRMQCHMTKQKEFTCLICENSLFSSLENYEKHIDSHCKALKATT